MISSNTFLKSVYGDYNYSCRKCGMIFCEECKPGIIDEDICEYCSDLEFDEEGDF